MKPCNSCHIPKEPCDYHNDITLKGGKKATCKTCIKIAVRQRRDGTRVRINKESNLIVSSKEPTVKLGWKREVMLARERMKHSKIHYRLVDNDRFPASYVDKKLPSYRIGEVR